MIDPPLEDPPLRDPPRVFRPRLARPLPRPPRREPTKIRKGGGFHLSPPSAQSDPPLAPFDPPLAQRRRGRRELSRPSSAMRA